MSEGDIIEGTPEGTPEASPGDVSPEDVGASASGDLASDVTAAPTDAPGVAATETADAQPVAAAAPALGFAPPTRRPLMRFAFVYGLLGAVVAGSAVVLVLGFVARKVDPAPPWSNWRPPSGSTSQMASAIATHVAAQYHLNPAGAQLVAVVSEPPQVTSGTNKVSISAIAVRKTADSDNGIQVFSASGAWTDEFCGLGTDCSIATGKATVLRGRLVRREALEVALYTFKFDSAISSLVAYMPPPPGSSSETLVYLQKSQFAQQLSEPLDKTLPLQTPPLPTSPDTAEAATIDKLTLPDTFSYSLTALPDGSAALVLDPLT